MSDYDLIIIGAGPKGIALAAKHWALANPNLSYAILERRKVGANWLGSSGYTDGKQRLVTPAEHDVGYPYASEPAINSRMQALSWESYQVSEGLRSDYVVREEKHPTHEELVSYLDWVSDNISANVLTTAAHTIEIDDGRWKVTTNRGSEKSSEGLVITGHGGPKRLGGRTYEHSHISDGRNFWQRRGAYKRIKPGHKIAVIGQGETAGAIALAILKTLQDKGGDSWDSPAKIYLICRQIGYYLRSQVEKDLRYFSEPGEWESLLEQQRRGIMSRADRGVVSAFVKHSLESSNLVEYVIAEADSPEGYTVPASGPLMLKLSYGRDEEKQSIEEEFAFVVSALGFDDLWFLDLFSDAAKRKLLDHVLRQQKAKDLTALRKHLNLRENAAFSSVVTALAANYKYPKPNTWLQRRFERLIEDDLSVFRFTPRLHLPRFAGLRQGPGIPNLNCLGLMSDRIWSWYL